jgi:LuxR family maltose regulon positive regulatory protein
LLDDTEALLRQTGLTAYYGLSMAHVARGKLLEGQGRLREADEALAEGIELARRGEARFDLSYGLLTHAEVKGGLGDRRAAKDLLREARQAVEACADAGVLPELVARVERRLRLLATDLTQREIGEALYVSFNTVKTHVKSIFRKLDVATRPDAVSRARELRLL